MGACPFFLEDGAFLKVSSVLAPLAGRWRLLPSHRVAEEVTTRQWNRKLEKISGSSRRLIRGWEIYVVKGGIPWRLFPTNFPP